MLLLERLGLTKEKKSLVPTDSDLRNVVESIVADANTILHEDVRSGLLTLAGLSPRRDEFEVSDKSSLFQNSGVDVVIKDGETTHVIASLGVGPEYISFINKLKLKDEKKWIIKSKALTEIRSRENLREAVENLIFGTPLPSEIVDISREATQKRQDEYMERVSAAIKASPLSFNRTAGKHK